MEHSEPKEQRNYVRLHMNETIIARMSIEQVNGVSVNSRSKPVLITELSPGGLRMLTHLELPSSSHYLLGFQLMIKQVEMKLNGHVVWRDADESQFRYGISLRLTASERRALISLLNMYLTTLCPDQLKIHELYKSMSLYYLHTSKQHLDQSI
ncbi:PilZ domain-containing protein [Paenibacillus profundus]|uniref:PilZ domain-containing protein n=1 Tax=Paenibacillus profundus TaxID=1173085 RepID=A0ABS8YAH2_9BACL|nr:MULTISPECIES: PilZ domain-containing protein [Paenibacillus]MCE5168928.1 PilZ domain-containing protein [Paenibacillus profundus]